MGVDWSVFPEGGPFACDVLLQGWTLIGEATLSIRQVMTNAVQDGILSPHHAPR